MAIKKKVAKAIPFAADEVLVFPCGTTAKVKSYGPGGVIIEIKRHSYVPVYEICIGEEALRMLPALSKRGLATVKRAQREIGG